MERKKQKVEILKQIFKNKKKASVDITSLSHELSKKQMIKIEEVENLLFEMKEDKLIEMVAYDEKKGYNYLVKLKPKGEFFVFKESNKLADFITGVIVYLILIIFILLFVFVLKTIFGGGNGA